MNFWVSFFVLAAVFLCYPPSCMAETIVILMDGTWNRPEYKIEGQPELGTDTNVIRMRDLLKNRKRYFWGIGTDGKKLVKAVNGAFGKEAEGKVQEAYDFAEAAYSSGDDFAIIGFSRGAATSRMLAKRISDQGIKGDYPKIRFLGLWDTVASLGVPTPKLSEFRKQFHDEHERLVVAKAVEQVVHLVALDEDRSLFRPTLVRRLADENLPAASCFWLDGEVVFWQVA